MQLVLSLAWPANSLTFKPREIKRESGENPGLSRSCKSYFTGKQHATEILGKAFASGRHSQKTCLLQEST